MSAKKEKKEKKKYKQEGDDEESEEGREIKLSLTKKQSRLKSAHYFTSDSWQVNTDIKPTNIYHDDFIPKTPLHKTTQV